MLCQAILFTILLNFAASEEDRFFWENDYVGKPVNFYHGAAYQIPVIEGEKVVILCKVRAVSEDSYKIIWDYESFHATTTGKTVLVNNTSGDEFAQDTITVNIDNPTDIDDKDIICSWENGQFSDTITLQFKVYYFNWNTHDRYSVFQQLIYYKFSLFFWPNFFFAVCQFDCFL